MREFIDKKLVIASNNEGKVLELKEILKVFSIQILSNKYFNIPEPIEDGNAFKDNAYIKAFNTASKTKLVSLSDDSGISFNALGGRPGIHSARYAGKKKDFNLAMKKLNEELKFKDDKSSVLIDRLMFPLRRLGLQSKYDCVIRCLGGGLVGQADAAALGISRALLSLNSSFRSSLKEEGCLTRDARVKERKKYGKRKARKAPQYRKR